MNSQKKISYAKRINRLVMHWIALSARESLVTPEELKAARRSFGLSAKGFAKLVRVESGRTVRRWEAGEREIPGPVIVLVNAVLAVKALQRYFRITKSR